jgi:hypothetical protein
MIEWLASQRTTQCRSGSPCVSEETISSLFILSHLSAARMRKSDKMYLVLLNYIMSTEGRNTGKAHMGRVFK